MKIIDGGVTAPIGFKAAGTRAGIKAEREIGAFSTIADDLIKLIAPVMKEIVK